MTGLKKNQTSSLKERKLLVEPNPFLSVTRQCQLLQVSRSSYYYLPAQETSENLRLMKILDEQYMNTPFYGYRRLTLELKDLGENVNEKRVRRLMKIMGIEALYPKKKTTNKGEGHRIYPYLLRGLSVEKPNQVWCSDITYIPLKGGFVYLVAIMDWYSRYVLSWELSNTMDTFFCVEALEGAFEKGTPEIFNTDQGSQFTSREFTGILNATNVKISMDGKGRVFDNIFIERLWRTVKYEDIYLKEYESVKEVKEGLRNYFLFYNKRRKHQSLQNKTPEFVYLNKM